MIDSRRTKYNLCDSQGRSGPCCATPVGLARMGRMLSSQYRLMLLKLHQPSAKKSLLLAFSRLYVGRSSGPPGLCSTRAHYCLDFRSLLWLDPVYLSAAPGAKRKATRLIRWPMTHRFPHYVRFCRRRFSRKERVPLSNEFLCSQEPLRSQADNHR